MTDRARTLLRLARPVAAAALAAAVAGHLLWRQPHRAARTPGDVDVIAWQEERLASLRPLLGARAGYCRALGREAAWLSPLEQVGQRTQGFFSAQYALAPIVLVPVLGQPKNGFVEPSAEDRWRALQSLDVLLLDAGLDSPEAAFALRVGFVPAREYPGGVLLRRGR